MQVREQLRADCKVAELEQQEVSKALFVLWQRQGYLLSDWSSSSKGLFDFVVEWVELR